MKEVILPPLRTHVPGVSIDNSKPTWHLPIHIYKADGIDLDFGPLLLFDRAIIDASSLEYITHSSRKDLMPIANSLHILKEEGYVVERDFGADLGKVREKITSHVRQMVNDPLPLREPLLKGIDGYRAHLPDLKRILPSFDEAFMSIGFGMHLLMMKKYGQINFQEKERLDSLMKVNKRRWTNSEIEEIRHLITPTITYLYQNIVLSELTEAPFIDVSYTSDLYNIVRNGSLQAFRADTNIKIKEIEEGQNFFNCIVPELRPASASAMVKMLKTKAVKDFREYISRAAALGQSITAQEYRKLLVSTLHKERKLRGAVGKLAWGERLLSLIPGIGPAVSGLSALTEKAITHQADKKSRWIYALIEASSKENV